MKVVVRPYYQMQCISDIHVRSFPNAKVLSYNITLYFIRAYVNICTNFGFIDVVINQFVSLLNLCTFSFQSLLFVKSPFLAILCQVYCYNFHDFCFETKFGVFLICPSHVLISVDIGHANADDGVLKE